MVGYEGPDFQNHLGFTAFLCSTMYVFLHVYWATSFNNSSIATLYLLPITIITLLECYLVRVHDQGLFFYMYPTPQYVIGQR